LTTIRRNFQIIFDHDPALYGQLLGGVSRLKRPGASTAQRAEFVRSTFAPTYVAALRGSPDEILDSASLAFRGALDEVSEGSPVTCVYYLCCAASAVSPEECTQINFEKAPSTRRALAAAVAVSLRHYYQGWSDVADFEVPRARQLRTSVEAARCAVFKRPSSVIGGAITESTVQESRDAIRESLRIVESLSDTDRYIRGILGTLIH